MMSKLHHYNKVIMSTMAFQFNSLTIIYSTVYSGADQRKHQSSASLAFVRGIHRSSVMTQRAGKAENVSIWWRHHVRSMSKAIMLPWLQPEMWNSYFLLAAECNVDNCQTCIATGCESCDDGYQVKNGTCEGKYVYITKQVNDGACESIYIYI